MCRKEQIRKKLFNLRNKISEQRKEEAKINLVKELYPRLSSFSYVLSFAKKSGEIDLWLLNVMLAKEGRLLLPRVDMNKGGLLLFVVRELQHHLVVNPKWNILEPCVNQCPLFSPSRIDCILVPGLGFDVNNQRIGYGKGCYDRFLANLTCSFYGIGFNEQYLSTPIPAQSHDVPLTQVYLF